MKTFLKMGLLGLMLAIAQPAFSQIYIGIGIHAGPPAPRHEVMMARPFKGAVWIAGYYRWAPKHHHYVWVRGHWERPPYRHAVWVEGRWEQRHGEWIYYKGGWEHEKSGPAPRVRRDGPGR